MPTLTHTRHQEHTKTPLHDLAQAFRDQGLSTPGYVIDHEALLQNGRLLREIQEKTGAKILLAQKAFACFQLYPTLRNFLAGTAASGICEARLGAEEFGAEVHVFSPAFKPQEVEELVGIADHLVFNSISQWERCKPVIEKASRAVSVGIRINPEYSESTAEIYDPCTKGSRFGVLDRQLDGVDLTGIEGIHFHTLCEQDAGALARTLVPVIEKFDPYIKQMKWINLGGGHQITEPGYDTELLCFCIRVLQDRYPGIEVYLEPGEAVAWDAGALIASVVDIVENGMQIAILDTSANAHMPDVLEMPYQPIIDDSAKAGIKEYNYRLAGPTCLSGDVIGDYSFDRPLKVGDQLVFRDMAHYTMVKNTTFNGVQLPSISVFHQDGSINLIREFGYEDYKSRLG